METTVREPADTERLAAWVRDHGPAVRGYLFGLTRRWDLADDLSQEVFCRAWQAQARYREQGNPRGYLLTIADRLACDHHRRDRRETSLEEYQRPVVFDPAQKLVNDETAKQLGLALDRLSPLQRRVLLMRYYGQLSFQEIADALDCPLSTALSHCHRGLRTLRDELVKEEL
jgi:RNA polymerase sigma-70 factor (ECF subfamily)